MPPFDPRKVDSPKSRIKRVVTVIDDGISSRTDISIVELELKNGENPFGFRWNVSNWSPNPDLGFPSSRGKPTWFIVPKDGMKNLIKTLKIVEEFLRTQKNTDKNSI
ncbi:MAG: hypothetical protein ACRYGB_13710 [Janthinobacterium lividum]